MHFSGWRFIVDKGCSGLRCKGDRALYEQTTDTSREDFLSTTTCASRARFAGVKKAGSHSAGPAKARCACAFSSTEGTSGELSKSADFGVRSQTEHDGGAGCSYPVDENAPAVREFPRYQTRSSDDHPKAIVERRKTREFTRVSKPSQLACNGSSWGYGARSQLVVLRWHAREGCRFGTEVTP